MISAECSDELHQVRICRCLAPGTMMNSGLDIMDRVPINLRVNIIPDTLPVFKLPYIEATERTAITLMKRW